jgi:predicted O-methyltransferase YrrM
VHNILSKIYHEDIYRGFSPMPESITGWGGTARIFEILIKQVRPRIIVEVGTWKGQSAITMAEACRTHQLDCAIICVDTWLGSEEHFLACPAELTRVNGYPRLYYQFLSNVVHRNVQDLIVPLPTTSLTAAKLLSQLGIEADLIYIDADHQYEAVMADLNAFLPLLSKSGVMFGHDYYFESVQQALSDFCAERQIGHDKRGTFWVLETR